MDGKVTVHGKISEQLAIRANKTSPGQLYDYDIFNFRTSLKLETMFRLQQCPDYQINLYGVWKEFYDYAHEVDSALTIMSTASAAPWNTGAPVIQQIRRYLP